MRTQQQVFQDALDSFQDQQNQSCVIVTDNGVIWPNRIKSADEILFQGLMDGSFNTYDPYGPYGGNYRLKLLENPAAKSITIPGGCGSDPVTINLDKLKPKFCYQTTPPPPPLDLKVPKIPTGGKLCPAGGYSYRWGR